MSCVDTIKKGSIYKCLADSIDLQIEISNNRINKLDEEIQIEKNLNNCLSSKLGDVESINSDLLVEIHQLKQQCFNLQNNVDNLLKKEKMFLQQNIDLNDNNTRLINQLIMEKKLAENLNQQINQLNNKCGLITDESFKQLKLHKEANETFLKLFERIMFLLQIKILNSVN